MIEKSDIENFVEQVYTYISVYDYGDHIRVTNGSAGMYADIRLENDQLHVQGERYTRTFNETYERTYHGLKEALVHIEL